MKYKNIIQLHNVSLVIALFCLPLDLLCQKARDPISIQPSSCCAFEEGSLILTKGGQGELELVSQYLASLRDSLNSSYIVIIPQSCLEEHEKDQFIGVKRAKVLIAFFSKYSGFNKDDFLILDTGPRKDWRKDFGCDTKSSFFFLKK